MSIGSFDTTVSRVAEPVIFLRLWRFAFWRSERFRDLLRVGRVGNCGKCHERHFQRSAARLKMRADMELPGL